MGRLRRHLTRIRHRHRVLSAARRARAQWPHCLYLSSRARTHPVARTQRLHRAHLGPQRRPSGSYVIPYYSFDFRRSTSISASVQLGQDRLRPIDYSALPDNVEYHSQTAGVHFYSAPVPYLAVSGGFYKGSTINFSPPERQRTGPGDR